MDVAVFALLGMFVTYALVADAWLPLRLGLIALCAAGVVYFVGRPAAESGLAYAACVVVGGLLALDVVEEVSVAVRELIVRRKRCRVGSQS
ncbi:MAG: hypothetical protein AAGA90_23905 [Actinomycetota bacterium]